MAEVFGNISVNLHRLGNTGHSEFFEHKGSAFEVVSGKLITGFGTCGGREFSWGKNIQTLSREKKSAFRPQRWRVCGGEYRAVPPNRIFSLNDHTLPQGKLMFWGHELTSRGQDDMSGP